jgi:membrane protease YdiL (CAAX protease family)
VQLKTFIQRHAIAAYFVLAFAISWGTSLVTMGPKFFAGVPLERLVDALPSLIGMMLGPFLSGLLLTWIVDGRSGVQALFARMGRWKVGGQWWLAALLLFPVVLVTVLLLLTRVRSSYFVPGFAFVGIPYGLLAGWFEETGWTGFATPRMQLKFGALATGLLLGFLHGIWHILADYMGSSGALGAYWFTHFAAMWLVGLMALRVITVWIYNRTGSLLLAQLTHAAFTGSLITLTPTPIDPANETTWYLVFAVAIWIVAAVIIVASHWRLAKPVPAAA